MIIGSLYLEKRMSERNGKKVRSGKPGVGITSLSIRIDILMVHQKPTNKSSDAEEIHHCLSS